MANKQRSYSTVFFDTDARKLIINTYANADSLRDALAHAPDDVEVLAFVGEPVPFSVDISPRVTLGEKKERKPRAKKQKAKAVEAKPEKKTNGTHHAPPPEQRFAPPDATDAE